MPTENKIFLNNKISHKISTPENQVKFRLFQMVLRMFPVESQQEIWMYIWS